MVLLQLQGELKNLRVLTLSHPSHPPFHIARPYRVSNKYLLPLPLSVYTGSVTQLLSDVLLSWKREQEVRGGGGGGGGKVKPVCIMSTKGDSAHTTQILLVHAWWLREVMKGLKGDRQSRGEGGVYVTITICRLCIEINIHLVTYALLLPCYPINTALGLVGMLRNW